MGRKVTHAADKTDKRNIRAISIGGDTFMRAFYAKGVSNQKLVKMIYNLPLH